MKLAEKALVWVGIFLAMATTAMGELGFPDCPVKHCSEKSASINQACVAAGMSGKPFPVVHPGGDGTCTCPCSCVSAETLVLSGDLDTMAVGDLRLGDEVYGVYEDAASSPVDHRLRSVIEKGDIRVLTFSNGRVLRASSNHTLVTDDGRIESAERLPVGSSVRDQDDASVTITANEVADFSGDLHNVIVNAASPRVSDHIIVTNTVQSGDWSLQATHDQIDRDIHLRMSVVETFKL